MKSIKYFIIILGFFIINLNVNATSLDLNLNCPSNAYSGDIISCNIVANTSDGSINGINANYVLENVTLDSFNVANGWSAYNNSANGFAIGNLNGVSGNNTIGVLKLKVTAAVGSTIKVGLTSIGASDTNYNDISASNASTTINIKEKPTVTTTTAKRIPILTELKIEGYEIPFDKNTFNYNLDVDYEVNKITISAATNRNNTINGTGEIILNEGENKVLITVTDQNNETTTYTIIVNRPVKASNVVANSVEDISNAFKSNESLTVNLNSENDELIVSKSVLDIIKNTDKQITYNIKEENEILYYYEFNGEKFTETFNDINLKINFINEDKNVDNILNDDKKIEFENEHKSYFPSGTQLNIKNIKNIKNIDNEIKLYKVNMENNLELINNKVKKNDNNYFSFEIEKGAKYILSNKNIGSKKIYSLLIIISISILIEATICGILIIKKVKTDKAIN